MSALITFKEKACLLDLNIKKFLLIFILILPYII